MQLVFFQFATNSRNFTINLSDLGKKLKDLKKTQRYEALFGLLGLKKVYKKQACSNLEGNSNSKTSKKGKSGALRKLAGIWILIVWRGDGEPNGERCSDN